MREQCKSAVSWGSCASHPPETAQIGLSFLCSHYQVLSRSKEWLLWTPTHRVCTVHNSWSDFWTSHFPFFTFKNQTFFLRMSNAAEIMIQSIGFVWLKASLEQHSSSVANPSLREGEGRQYSTVQANRTLHKAPSKPRKEQTTRRLLSQSQTQKSHCCKAMKHVVLKDLSRRFKSFQPPLRRDAGRWANTLIPTFNTLRLFIQALYLEKYIVQ